MRRCNCDAWLESNFPAYEGQEWTLLMDFHGDGLRQENEIRISVAVSTTALELLDAKLEGIICSKGGRDVCLCKIDPR
jgi:hypothetical protein